MKIGITLNETVRSFCDTVEHSHEAYLYSLNAYNALGESGETVIPQDMTATPIDENEPDSFVLSEVSFETKRRKLNLAAEDDLFSISTKLDFESQGEYEEFLYEEMAFNIFARTGLVYPEAMSDLNTFYGLLASDNHDVTIVSQERKNSKQATLLFLSQNKFQCNNIKFLYNYSKVWEIYDLIITANPFIIASKPENKLCFKIESEANLDLEADESFENIYEAYKYYKSNRKK